MGVILMYLEFLQEARDEKEKYILDKNIKDDKFDEWVKSGLEKSFLTKKEEDDNIELTS